MLVVSCCLKIIESADKVKVQDERAGKPFDKNPAGDKSLSLGFIPQPEDSALIEARSSDRERVAGLVICWTDPTW